jgi:hypothetical protein
VPESVQTFFSRCSHFFEGQTPPHQRHRSRAGILLILALMPLLLGVLACLPVPVGDPEKSRIDPAMSGIWIQQDGIDPVMVVLDPYDKRTWLLSHIELSVGQDPEPAVASETGANEAESETTPLNLLHPDYKPPIKIERVSFYKSWLTRIKGVTFITWESKNVSDTLPGKDPGYWLVFRVRQSGDELLYMDEFDYEIDGLGKVKTRKEAEKIIRRHVNEPEFYKPSATLHKVAESDYETVARLLKDFGIDFG